MTVLVEILVAMAVVTALLLPVCGLTSSNMDRSRMTAERQELHNLAQAMMERYDGEGLADLLRGGLVDRRRVFQDDPQLSDDLLGGVVDAEVLRDGRLFATVSFEPSVKGVAGLGALRAHVRFERGAASCRVSAFRLVSQEQ